MGPQDPEVTGGLTKQLLTLLSATDVTLFEQCFRSAKRGIAVVSRPSVRLSVTLMYRERMCWDSSKLIRRITSPGFSLLGATTSAI